jgi:hypothetical protein
MPDTPIISILVPQLNGERFSQRCLNAISLRFSGLMLVLTNASTDGL